MANVKTATVRSQLPISVWVETKKLPTVEKAISARDPYTRWLDVDPTYDDLRADLRFKKLLKALNLPE